jgi:hypothetical protein
MENILLLQEIKNLLKILLYFFVEAELFYNRMD